MVKPLSNTPSYVLRPEDREFYEREVASFLPDRVFDAHCHVWHSDFVEIADIFPPDVDHAMYMRLMQDIHPVPTIGALFISLFREEDSIAASNEWTAAQTRVDPLCRGTFFIRPDDDPEWVRQEVRRLGLHGLKCYHTVARNVPTTFQADIPAYLPESIVKVADEEGWVIMLHMVKSRGVADPGNIHWIRRYCESYPNMQLILAHSARGFQPSHNFEGLEQLRGLDNLWCDTSANCEPMAHVAIIRILGHEKLLYGGDLPATHQRGRSVAAADSFVWLYGDTDVWVEKHQTIRPVFTGLEHLRSLKWACWSQRLSDSQVEDIFWNNAARLFGLDG